VEISSRRGNVQKDYPVVSDAAAVLRVSTDIGSIHVQGGRAAGRSSVLDDDLSTRWEPRRW
jgi:hypothetical protein